MKNKLKVSIITVCYNSEGHIDNAIKSVLAQTYKNIEYIIIDGKSTDGTLDIVKKYKDKISKVISEKDKGIYDAMNKGIKIATGDIIYFLNADDKFYDKDVINDIVNEFNNDFKIDIVYGKVHLVNVPKDLLPHVEDYKIINKKKDFLKQSICHQALFARKRAFDNTGLFNTKYRVYADYDWLLSSFSCSIKMKFINRYIATYNYQGFSYRNLSKAKKEKINVVYKNFSLSVFLFYVFRYVFLSTLNSKRKELLRLLRSPNIL